MTGWLAQNLPRVLAADPFMQRFLQIFEGIIDDVRDRIDNLEHYLDPTVAPLEYVRWLGKWANLDVDAAFEAAVTHDGVTRDELEADPRQRIVVKFGAPLFRMRGTRTGLEQYLRVTGGPVEIDDPGGVTGYTKGRSAPPPPEQLEPVRVTLATTGFLTVEQIEGLIRLQLPADTDFELTIDPSIGATEPLAAGDRST